MKSYQQNMVCSLLFLLIMIFLVLVVDFAYAESGKTPVRIGVSLGLTGEYKEVSKSQSQGFKLWEKHVNERGGILGRPIDVIVRDDHGKSENAKKIYQDFIVREKVDFVFGPYSTPITAAVLPLTEDLGYPILGSGASSDELWKKGYKYLFGIIPQAGRFTVGFLNILADAKVKRVAVIYFHDTFSQNIAEGVKRWAPEYNLQLVFYHGLANGKPDYVATIRQVKESGAEALLLAGRYEESIAMRKAMRQVNWMPKAYWAALGPTLDTYKTALGTDAEGAFSSSIWEAREDLKFPDSAKFLRDFIQTYKENPSYMAARAYAAGQILELAILRAGDFNRNRVAQALYDLDTKTLIGRYLVDRTGAHIKGFPMITQWQNGKREIVWPEELRTAVPIISK